MNLTGLIVRAPSGATFTWAGSRGQGLERRERWRTSCAQCGQHFHVRARVPGGLRYNFLHERAELRPGAAVRIALALPARCVRGGFELTRCWSCREAEQALSRHQGGAKKRSHQARGGNSLTHQGAPRSEPERTRGFAIRK